MQALNLKFAHVFHLMDSSTSLGYLHKEDTNLKPYDRVRVTKIQTVGEFEGGCLKIGHWLRANTAQLIGRQDNNQQENCRKEVSGKLVTVA